MAQQETQRQINDQHNGKRCGLCGSGLHSDSECPLNSDDDRPFFKLCDRCMEYGHDDAECTQPVSRGSKENKREKERRGKTEGRGKEPMREEEENAGSSENEGLQSTIPALSVSSAGKSSGG